MGIYDADRLPVVVAPPVPKPEEEDVPGWKALVPLIRHFEPANELGWLFYLTLFLLHDQQLIFSCYLEFFPSEVRDKVPAKVDFFFFSNSDYSNQPLVLTLFFQRLCIGR